MGSATFRGHYILQMVDEDDEGYSANGTHGADNGTNGVDITEILLRRVAGAVRRGRRGGVRRRRCWVGGVWGVWSGV